MEQWLNEVERYSIRVTTLEQYKAVFRNVISIFPTFQDVTLRGLARSLRPEMGVGRFGERHDLDLSYCGEQQEWRDLCRCDKDTEQLPYPTADSLHGGASEMRAKEKAFLGAAYVDSRYVCVGPDGAPLTPNAVSMHFRRMIRKNGLPYIRFHGLRYSVATLLHSAGRDIQDIQGWLGRSDISITANIYSHFLYSAKRDMADSIDAALR